MVANTSRGKVNRELITKIKYYSMDDLLVIQENTPLHIKRVGRTLANTPLKSRTW